MEINSIKTVESSPAHMYILSDQEGLVVFRTSSDTLQYLYASEGMERRGDRIQADVRFAYLYGDSQRLTVVEPTSVHGVYSSTNLPATPLSVQRLGNHIFIAMGPAGLGRLSLENPETVDSDPDILFESDIEGQQVIDLASDLGSRLYALTDERQLLLVDRVDADENIELNRIVELDRNTSRIFLTSDELIGTDQDGEIFLINADGQTSRIASVDDPVQNLRIWQNKLVVRTQNNRLWIGEFGDQPELWKDNDDAGNFFAIANENLWIAEYNQITPVVETGTTPDEQEELSGAEERPEIRPLENITIPFPRPVIIPLELASNHNPSEIDFSYRSNVQNASIRGQSLYWQPSSNQIGRTEFTIAATTSSGISDTVSFTVDVRPFNTPPRFTPVRPVTINVNEEFELEFNAVDPDGLDPELIRYLGVDLPDGAELEERTGEFSWTPNIRQVGEYRFQVIATDQFGAATSKDVTINVIETDPDEEAEIDF